MALLKMEQQQISWFRDSFELRETALFPESREVTALLGAVLNPSIWMDNSGKGDPPPDFLCPSEHLMMEVMGVDAHTHMGKKRLINPYRARETELRREIEASGILGACPGSQELWLNPDTGLPTKEDHGYAFYLEEFRRVIRSHGNRASKYRENHPGHRLVFFVFDDSSGGYLQVADGLSVPNVLDAGQVVRGKQHHFWADASFLEAVYSCGADFLIWHAPWKYAWDIHGHQLSAPKTCVYDLAHRVAPTLSYTADRMVSLEA